jgi:hypothetical protein
MSRTQFNLIFNLIWKLIKFDCTHSGIVIKARKNKIPNAQNPDDFLMQSGGSLVSKIGIFKIAVRTVFEKLAHSGIF